MNSGKVLEAMTQYFGNDVKRVNHFIKVFGFAKIIGEGENLSERELEILEAAAAVHDIGIKMSEQKYNSSAGKYQEKEGPAEAEKLLRKLGYEDDFISEVCYIVAHHHTYTNIDTLPYQILVEADFIVNLFEDNAGITAIKSAYEKIFVTDTGKKIFANLYL